MIREKAMAGKSAYAIGKELGISKNTALKYIERQDDSPARNSRPSKLDEFKPVLHELMGNGIFNCVVLLERLREAGYDENDMKEAEEMLQAYKETFGDKKDLVSTQVLHGFAADEIIKLLNESDVDMAILGSRGIGSPLYRNILGSVTNKVLHHAEKPVLVVR